jgi:toxin FitB
MIVLDTNVVSEAMKPPDQSSQEVIAWLSAQRGGELYTTAITAAEILGGVSIMPQGKRRNQTAEAARRVLDLFGNRILGFDLGAAKFFADATAIRRKAGKSIDAFDLLIGAVARQYGMAIATRNTYDFEDCGVPLIDPWKA